MKQNSSEPDPHGRTAWEVLAGYMLNELELATFYSYQTMRVCRGYTLENAHRKAFARTLAARRRAGRGKGAKSLHGFA